MPDREDTSAPLESQIPQEVTENGESMTIVSDTRTEKRPSAFERLSDDLSNDHRVLKEITLGKRIGFYRIRGELGSGNFSQVKLGIHSLTKEKVAVKILDKTKLDQKTQRLLSREISSMERLHHPNVIRLYEVVETLAKLHIIMEYAGGGELFNKISNEGRLTMSVAKCVFAQVVAAVQHMHSHHIIHRDIKAENVFFATPYLVKVGDFGFSTFSRSDNSLNTFCGSPPYAAPELFKDEHYQGVYVDIWALGILLFFMVTGVMPFRAETVAKLKKVILDGSFSTPSFLPHSCQTLIQNILIPEPDKRFNIIQIKENDWLEGQDFPVALPAFKSVHTAENGHTSEEESEARDTLRALGITDDHVKAAHVKDSRSNITGTYRIVLHKILKRNSKEMEYFNDDDSRSYTYSSARQSGRRDSTDEKKSKLCTIL